jgi:L-lactate dehydrogenase
VLTIERVKTPCTKEGRDMPDQAVETSAGRRTPKVSIIGAGMVGSSLGYSLIVERAASEVVLLDVNRDRAEGEAKDIAHAAPFGAPTLVRSGGYDDLRGSDVVVITAGVAQKPGETRLDLVGRNVSIYRDIVPKLERAAPDCVVLVVSNPVDVLTWATLKLSGFPRERVIGAGTVLDTARFRHEIGRHCGIDPRNIHAYIIGEHGDSEVPVWSLANIAGVPVREYCKRCGRGCPPGELDRIFDSVRSAAYEIIRLKGATYFAIALGTTRMIEAILRDQNTVVTASTRLEGQYGLRDVCLSVPVVLARPGVVRALEIPLADDERRALERSAGTLKDVIRNVGL